jgi:hypothetical protein
MLNHTQCFLLISTSAASTKKGVGVSVQNVCREEAELKGVVENRGSLQNCKARLNQLAVLGYLELSGGNLYSLTAKGKKIASATAERAKKLLRKYAGGDSTD